MKRIIRAMIAALPAGVADRLHAAKHRIHWLTKGGGRHVEYFDSYRTRSVVLDVLKEWLDEHPLPDLKVLEFGCSGGNNLLLLREIMPMPVQYTGIDIQPNAIAFARERFPDDTFLVGDDLMLSEKAKGLGHFDVFIASAVLHYIPQQRCQAVLTHAAQLADLVLICDYLSHFDQPTGENDGVFLHPYALMCQKTGLEIVIPPQASATGHRYSTFMVRSRNR